MELLVWKLGHKANYNISKIHRKTHRCNVQYKIMSKILNKKQNIDESA